MTWSIGDTPEDAPMITVHDAVWSVLTSDTDEVGGLCLRVVDHGQDLEAGEGMRIVFTREVAEAMCQQLHDEVLPYAQGLET